MDDGDRADSCGVQQLQQVGVLDLKDPGLCSLVELGGLQRRLAVLVDGPVISVSRHAGSGADAVLAVEGDLVLGHISQRSPSIYKPICREHKKKTSSQKKVDVASGHSLRSCPAGRS